MGRRRRQDRAHRAWDRHRPYLAPPPDRPFRGTWERAGFDPAAGYSDALLDELIVYGSEAEVAAGLGQWIKDGMGEVLAHPLLDLANREGSLARAFAAIARAARQVA